jgi:heterodisulfide reductase subunit B
LDRCARLSAAALGIQLEEAEKWQCCGAAFPLTSESIAQKLSAVRVLAQAGRQNRTLVTLCAACHHVFKHVNHQIKNDAGFRAAIKSYDDQLDCAGETEVLHYMETLRQYIGFDELRKKVVNPLTGRRIGAYYGCLLLRPSDVMGFDDAENPKILEDFIRALGAEPVVYPIRNECCGGYRSLEDRDKAQSLAERVVDSAVSRRAEMLVTACPLCQYQLVEAAAGRLDVCYFTELLAEALDIDDDDDE